MKKHLLSLVSIVTMMGLSACSFPFGNSSSSSKSNSEDTMNYSTSDESTDTGTSEEIDYGTFPVQYFDNFTKDCNVFIPRIKTTQVWELKIVKAEVGNYVSSCCDDNGTVGVDSLEDAYKAACIASGWINPNYDYYPYEYYGYFYDDPTNAVEVQFFTEDGQFNLFVMVFGSGEDFYTYADNFPGDALDEFLELTAPKINHPAEWAYFADEYFFTYCDDNGTIGTDSIEDKYLAACVAANWICTNDEDHTYDEEGFLYSNPENTVEICFFSIEDYQEDGSGIFMLSAYFVTGEDEEDDVVDDYKINLSNEKQITSSASNKVVWETPLFTMTVETTKTSTVDVGNGSYLSDPLRLYMYHKITFTWKSAAPTEIKIGVNTDDQKSDIENISSGATITGATASVSGNVVTYSVNASATSVTILVAGTTKKGKGQTHIDYVQFVGK